jgi:DNA modification methylase
MKIPITCKVTEYETLERIQTFQGNLKSTDKQRIEKIKASILKYGFSFPVFIWGLKILDGHQRLTAIKELIEDGHEIDAVPIVRIIAADEKEAAEKLLLINSRYAEITQDGFDEFVAAFHINLTDIADILTLPDIDFDTPDDEERNECDLSDEIPDFDDIPKLVSPGQLWRLGEHYLFCGDCTDADAVYNLMHGRIAEMLFTSPPYSDMRKYNGNDLSIETIVKFIGNFKPFCNYQVINLGLKKKEYKIVSYWDDYIKAAVDAGYKFLSWNVWDKMAAGNISDQRSMFAIEHEWIFVFGNEAKRLNRTIEKSESSNERAAYLKRDKSGRLMRKVREPDGSLRYTSFGNVEDYKNIGTVCQVNNKTRNELINKHPATMPIELPEIYIEAVTDKGNIVVDPFAGSGTTLIACEKLDRQCFAMEISPDYCNMIIERFKRGFKGKVLLSN